MPRIVKQSCAFPAVSRQPMADGRDPFPCRMKLKSAIGFRPSAFGRAMSIVLSFTAAAHACNVPVFRFALERWRPDPYRVTVIHRGPLADADRVLIADLETRQEKLALNVAVRTIDLSELDDADREFVAALGDAPLPSLVVHYPAHLRIPMPVWSGPLSAESIARASDSPLRQEIVRRLVDGQTAVWLLLECGQAEKDDAAMTLVEQQLQKLEQELKLPELTDASEDKLLAATPLKLGFSVLRVPRSDAEQPLIQMLLNSESDLAETSEPMVFPVFGRGRALLPLIGAGVTASNIHDSAAFLVGACSCEVKEQNPGFDLLLAADWDVLLTQDGVPLTAASNRGQAPQGDAELVPIPSGAAKTIETVTVQTVHGNGWIFIGLLFAGAIVILALMARH